MSVYQVPGRGWRYDFWYRGERHQSQSPAFYPLKSKAQEAEDKERDRLKLIATGAALDDRNSPFIHDWAEVYATHAIAAGDIAPDSTVLSDIKVVLRFFGRRPAKPEPVNKFRPHKRRESRPYLDLTLAAVVRDDNWILKFEEWIEQRGVSGSTRNKYRSAMSNMFALAMEPRFRRETGIVRNPFAEVRRDPQVKRYTTFDGDANLVAVRQASPAHLQLAIDIALYGLKFRRGSILDLEWSKSRTSKAWVDDKMEYLIADSHKTKHHTGLRQVAVIVPELKQILIAAKKRQDAINKRLSKRYGRTYSTCNHVVQWQGKPVADIKKAFRAACERAGVRYGLNGGVTFHSIRHEQGTEAAREGIEDAMAQAIGGWKTASARAIYKHLVPENEREAMLRMARATKRKLARGARALRDSVRDFRGNKRQTQSKRIKIVATR